LKSQLEDECKLQEKYLELIECERQAIRNLNESQRIAELEKLTAKREILCFEIKQANEARLHLLSAIPESKTVKLSDLVKLYFRPNEAAELKPFIDRLKSLIQKSQNKGLEFNQIIGFSLNLINGLTSIFWSASQSVLRCYSKQGKIKEQFHPSQGRASTVLKQV